MQVEKRALRRSANASPRYGELINGGRYAFLSAPLTAAYEGAVPVLLNEHCIGTVGASSVKLDQDAQIAKAGAASVVETQDLVTPPQKPAHLWPISLHSP